MQVLSYSFRIFFLATALAGTVLVPLWLLVWNGNLSPSLALPGVLWHAHEMLSGFLSAAIAG
ncbi:MAG: NnrS family protein, partial [Alcanivoracaceae bacterium]